MQLFIKCRYLGETRGFKDVVKEGYRKNSTYQDLALEESSLSQKHSICKSFSGVLSQLSMHCKHVRSYFGKGSVLRIHSESSMPTSLTISVF